MAKKKKPDKNTRERMGGNILPFVTIRDAAGNIVSSPADFDSKGRKVRGR